MNVSQVKNCYGCMACIDKCPKQCITTRKDKLGHFYPLVAQESCIDCNACIKVCPSINNNSLLNQPKSVWAAWRTEDYLRLESSSGGVATALSEYFINRGGAVYGCAFIPPFSFKHIRCTTVEDLKKLRGSKYVQSDMTGIYRLMQIDLKTNKEVLFIGTPCQTAGVRSFFKDKNSNLFVIDLICHGVPSVQILKDSIPLTVLKKTFNNIKFRENTHYQFSICKEDTIIYSRKLNSDLYLKGFFTNLFNRESCYSCQYAQQKRNGDITLGDFWGVEKLGIQTDINKGVSLCMINTFKGEQIFKAIDIEKVQYLINDAVNCNKPLNGSSKRRINAYIFKCLYPMLGLKWSVIFSIPAIVIKNFICRK